jgi:hypothetical protein
MRSDIHNSAYRVAIAPIATAVSDNTAMVGEWIDRQGFEAVTFAILTGTLADTDATFSVLVEDANDDAKSDAAAVPDAGLITQTADVAPELAAGFDFADDKATKKIGYVQGKRYVRLTVTPAGNSGSAPIAAVAHLSRADLRPVA